MLYRKMKGLRSDMGMTQEDMSSFLGIGIRNYRNKEKGITPFTQVEIILIMKKANLSYQEVGEIFFNKESNKLLYETYVESKEKAHN